MTTPGLIYRRGNLHTGPVYGVVVNEPFGSSELHGPFSSENEAWNYGMRLANESDGTQSFALVHIETPLARSIARAEEIRRHRVREGEATRNLIADMEREGLL